MIFLYKVSYATEKKIGFISSIYLLCSNSRMIEQKTVIENIGTNAIQIKEASLYKASEVLEKRRMFILLVLKSVAVRVEGEMGFSDLGQHQTSLITNKLSPWVQ